MVFREEPVDQRVNGRYPIVLEVQYKLLRGDPADRVDRVGCGRTLNLKHWWLPREPRQLAVGPQLLDFLCRSSTPTLFRCLCQRGLRSWPPILAAVLDRSRKGSMSCKHQHGRWPQNLPKPLNSGKARAVQKR